MMLMTCFFQGAWAKLALILDLTVQSLGPIVHKCIVVFTLLIRLLLQHRTTIASATDVFPAPPLGDQDDVSKLIFTQSIT